MSEAEDNIQNTKNAYAAFATGDIEAASADLDDQIEWVVPGNSTLSGTYRGKDEVMGFWMKLAEGGFSTTPEHFLGDDERVVVLTNVSAGGESADSVDVLTFRNGKVVKFQTAGDTAMQERVWGSK
jgi:ketosteroid isomerase-like protein